MPLDRNTESSINSQYLEGIWALCHDQQPKFLAPFDVEYRGTANQLAMRHCYQLGREFSSAHSTGRRNEALDNAEYFFTSQKQHGHMSYGARHEQMTPSHAQTWLAPAAGFLFLARKHRLRELERLALGWWADMAKLWKVLINPAGVVVAPGERSTLRARTSMVQDVCAALVLDRDLPKSATRGSWWNPKHLDKIGPLLLREMVQNAHGESRGGQLKITPSAELPPLRFPMIVKHYRQGKVQAHHALIPKGLPGPSSKKCETAWSWDAGDGRGPVTGFDQELPIEMWDLAPDRVYHFGRPDRSLGGGAAEDVEEEGESRA